MSCPSMSSGSLDMSRTLGPKPPLLGAPANLARHHIAAREWMLLKLKELSWAAKSDRAR